MVAATAPSTEASTWLSQRERGTLLGIRLTIWIATLCGRRVASILVTGIALWYRLFDRRATRASKEWLTRIHGEPPGYWAVYRHVRTFTQVTVDRVFLMQGRLQDFEITQTGREHLEELRSSGRGAMLLGAHLGSFDVMRAASVGEQIPIQILGYFANARMINALLERLNPGEAARVVHLSDEPVGAMVEVRSSIDQGGLVAILGDRVGLNDREVEVDFCGAPAAFPQGPMLLAAALRCPVYLVCGLYTPPNRYDLFCEPFAERVRLPRRDREAALREYVQRYAERLEHYCRRAPDNWFNFYDFWKPR